MPIKPNEDPSSTQSEAEFLAAYDPSHFERPSLATDVVILTATRGALRVVVYRRTQHPRIGTWALPGGFVRVGESTEAAARRLLADKAGLSDVFLEQLYTFSQPDRDPRGHIVSVAYYALVAAERLNGSATAQIRVEWPGETGGPVEVLDPTSGEPLPLFVDHADIIGMAVKRIRGKLNYTPIGFQLLPPEFTLRELQAVHEAILGESVNKDSFRRRMLASGYLEATGERERGVAYRPAELYRFTRRSAV